MATLDKRGSIWYVNYMEGGRFRRKSTGTSSKQLAQEIMKKIEENALRVRQGLEPIAKIQQTLLSEFIAMYLIDRKKVGKATETIRTDEYALKRLLAFTGDCSLNSIGSGVALRYRNYKLETVMPASASIELRSIRAAFNWAVEKPGVKYLYFNPFRQKGMIPSSEERKIPLFLSPDEKTRFFEAIDNDNHLRVFKFLLLTGCRRGEALNLTWANVDFEQMQLTFRRTKTKKDRTIPINLELMQVLLQLDRSREKLFNYDPDWISRLFKRYLNRAGIEKDLHLHCLRHTAASDLVRQGVHLTKISKFLGHSSVKVTEIYTHVLPEELREVADVLSCIG
ncbi:MAG: tyrosine-type recombinase/integrase [bacterium]|nr:tyrosine-type recombinase/integrase [bacterium]